MKYSSISILCAALTASASAFVSPSLVTKRTVVPIAYEEAAQQTCRYSTQASTEETAVTKEDDKLNEVIHHLLGMSEFVYAFSNVRRIVKKNMDTIKKKKTGLFSSEEYKVDYDTPALILTQRGAQELDNNQYLKYDITADAIKLFMEKNRKWFSEPEEGGDWTFDETVTEKTEPFVLEGKVERATKENIRFIDFVSDDRRVVTKHAKYVLLFLSSILCELILLSLHFI